MNTVLPPRLKRSLVFLLPICLLVVLLFFLSGYIPASLFLNALLILLALVLVGVTVRLVLQRDRRVHDQETRRSGSLHKR
jgi:TRAP-type uncharacterized transport system fused permease subunit